MHQSKMLQYLFNTQKLGKLIYQHYNCKLHLYWELGVGMGRGSQVWHRRWESELRWGYTGEFYLFLFYFLFFFFIYTSTLLRQSVIIYQLKFRDLEHTYLWKKLPIKTPMHGKGISFGTPLKTLSHLSIPFQDEHSKQEFKTYTLYVFFFPFYNFLLGRGDNNINHTARVKLDGLKKIVC